MKTPLDRDSLIALLLAMPKDVELRIDMYNADDDVIEGCVLCKEYLLVGKLFGKPFLRFGVGN